MRDVDFTDPLLRPIRAPLQPPGLPAPVPLDAPGTAVMTDLAGRPLVAVEAGEPIDAALASMRDAGVRLAFVLDGRRQLRGLITAYDILGDKPARLLHARGVMLHGATRADVQVADLMLPVERWQVAEARALSTHTVADVVRLLRRTGLTHLPVVERTTDGSDRLRGLISAAEVARRTGTDTAGLPLATTFAEIEETVAGGRAP